jgi:acyl-CoA synthetase (NDP forming)
MALEPAARESGKPVCCVWLTQWLDGPGTMEVETSPYLALFRSMERCMATLAAWHRYDRRLRTLDRPSARRSDPAARAALAAERRQSSGSLTESAAKRVLAAYGVPVVPERLVRDADEAVDAARGFGWPVVLKVQSADVPHKTEAGGVRLDLRSEDAVREAHAAILASVRAYAPQARIDGILVQPMVRRDLELIVGGRRDPLFGPTVVVGLGGVFVELLKDSAVALAPIGLEGARELLDSLRGRALLDGFRGSAPVDVDRVADVVARVSELLADHPDSIEELDLNPLAVSDGAVVAVDALVGFRTAGDGNADAA